MVNAGFPRLEVLKSFEGLLFRDREVIVGNVNNLQVESLLTLLEFIESWITSAITGDTEDCYSPYKELEDCGRSEILPLIKRWRNRFETFGEVTDAVQRLRKLEEVIPSLIL
jgi:hypothetical protein